MFKKENIIQTLLIVWATVSIIYIGYITWTDYKVKGITQAYQAGKADTVNGIIKQSEDAKCQAFTIFNGDMKVELVATNCLQKAPQTQPTPGDTKAK